MLVSCTYEKVGAYIWCVILIDRYEIFQTRSIPIFLCHRQAVWSEWVVYVLSSPELRVDTFLLCGVMHLLSKDLKHAKPLWNLL